MRLDFCAGQVQTGIPVHCSMQSFRVKSQETKPRHSRPQKSRNQPRCLPEPKYLTARLVSTSIREFTYGLLQRTWRWSCCVTPASRHDHRATTTLRRPSSALLGVSLRLVGVFDVISFAGASGGDG